MSEPAAKQGDSISSDGSSKLWVQPPGAPPPTQTTSTFSFEGPLNNNLSSNVFISGKPAVTVNSTVTNSKPPATQKSVTSKGTILSVVNNTGTVSSGSSSVFINGKAVARNSDKAKTWDYSSGPPGTGIEVENATISSAGTVLVGG